MRKFHSYQLWFLIPGILLVMTSVHVPVSYLHKQLFWAEAEALIGERVERGEGPDVEVLYNMDFTDERGIRHHTLMDDDDSFAEGEVPEHVHIYYDRTNPEHYELVNHARYLLILFLPFGLLCCYLGWPEKVSSAGVRT